MNIPKFKMQRRYFAFASVKTRCACMHRLSKIAAKADEPYNSAYAHDYAGTRAAVSVADFLTTPLGHAGIRGFSRPTEVFALDFDEFVIAR